MNELANVLMSGKDAPVRLVYGVATAANTVQVRGSSVAVALPAITPVRSGDYCAVLESGADRVIVGPVGGVTTWTQPTFVNSWTDYGGSYALAAYRKVGDLVEVRGAIKDGTLNGTAFTLPAGFRPPADLRFASPDSATITVDSAGALKVFSAANTIIGINLSFSTT